MIVAGLVYVGVKRAHDPKRALIPDRTAPITAIQPQLDKLQREDRQLVIGYLLLQRGEVGSLSTHGISFTAKTLGEAIEAQKALLVPIVCVGETKDEREAGKALGIAAFSVGIAQAALDAATGRHDAGVGTIADVLQAPERQGLFLALYFVAGGLGMPLWVRLSAAWGKTRAWMAGMSGRARGIRRPKVRPIFAWCRTSAT